MGELFQVLEKVRTKIAQHQGKGITEANTKAALINPVLDALGWHVGNLDEVSMEFKYAPSHNPVDYALLLNRNPVVLVEAKALGHSLASGNFADQIMGYAGTSGVKWVVLTNGDEYQIFNALVQAPFSQKLLADVRLTNPNSPTESTLDLLSMRRIENGDIEAVWQQLFSDRQVLAALKSLFSPASAPLLLNFIKKHIKGLTPKEIQASLSRVLAQFTFPAEPGTPSGEQVKVMHPPVSSVSLEELLGTGILMPGKLVAHYMDTSLEAELLSSGLVKFQGKE